MSEEQLDIEMEAKKKAEVPIGENLELIRNVGEKYHPESSSIVRCTYLPDAEALIIDFRSGGSYLYDAVSRGIWDELLSAESAGKFVNSRIAHSFKYRKIELNDGREVVS